MTQTVPATCVLGPGRTGLTIGLRVLNLDGSTYAAFATTGVAETSTAGTYRKAGGVVCPDAGGYIVWGTALVDYAEATVESASVNVTTFAGVSVAPADANGNVPVVLYPTQGAVTFGQVKIIANVTGEGALHMVNSHAGGSGQYSSGGLYGARNVGDYGQSNLGNVAGLYNAGTAYGQANISGGSPVSGVDAPGIRAAVGLTSANLNTQLAAIDPLTAQETANALKLAPAAGAAAAGSAMAYLAAIDADTSLVAGAGTYSYSNTVDDGSGNLLDGVFVELATDSAFTNVINQTHTNSLGAFTVYSDIAGAHYLRLTIGGYTTGTQTVTLA